MKQSNRKQKDKQPIDFSKKLMIFSCIILVTILIIDIVSWFMWFKISDLLSGGKWFFMTCLGFYMAKSGYEYGVKLKYDAEKEEE